MLFSVEMLPANYGDAILVSYGPEDRPHRVLVDCGFKSTYRAIMKRLFEPDDGRLELLVLSHVDEDHIQGAIPLLADRRVTREHVGDVWFNGWKHLARPDEMGALQGEFFAAILEKKSFHWNHAWGGGTVVVPGGGSLPEKELEGGLKLTLLSPTQERLEAMRRLWRTKVREAGIDPGDAEAALELLAERRTLQPDRLGEQPLDRLARREFKEDNTIPNGSSLAVLAEYRGRSVLLAADAHPSVLATSVERLLDARGDRRLRLDALKVSHHGSAGNTSPRLLALLDCRQFLFSTNGAQYDHPTPECVARIVTHRDDQVTLRFNYSSAETRTWLDRSKQRDYGYSPLLPADGGAVISWKV